MTTPKRFLIPIDLSSNEIKNFRLENLSIRPSDPEPGRVYFDKNDKMFYVYNGEEWISGSEGEITEEDLEQLIDRESSTLWIVEDYDERYNLTLRDDFYKGDDVLVLESGNIYKYNEEAPKWYLELDNTLEGYARKEEVPSTFKSSVGNGESNPVYLTHGLGTRDVIVSVRENNYPYSIVYPNIEMVDEDSILIEFESIPQEDEYKVMIIQT